MSSSCVLTTTDVDAFQAAIRPITEVLTVTGRGPLLGQPDAHRTAQPADAAFQRKSVPSLGASGTFDTHRYRIRHRAPMNA